MLMLQNMANADAEDEVGRAGQAWEDNPTRRAILDAARRVAEREGADAITLAQVAGEAGFAPPAIYTYFVSRNDLSLAVVADNVAAFARPLRGEAAAPAAPEPQTESGFNLAVPVSECGLPAEDDRAEDDCVEYEAEAPSDAADQKIVSLADIEQAIGVVLAGADLDDGTPDEVDSTDAAESPDAFPEEVLLGADAEPATHRYASAWEMEAAIVRLEQTVARLEAQPVDSWLERRLRVFERTLTDIEARMEKAERDSAAAFSTVGETCKALDQRLDEAANAAAARGVESQQNFRAIAEELHAYVKDISSRLGSVETRLSRMAGHGGDAGAPHFGARAASLPGRGPLDEPTLRSVLTGGQDAEPAFAGERASFPAARRAAQGSAAEDEATLRDEPKGFLQRLRPGNFSRRTLRLVAVILAIIVLGIGASIVLKKRAAAPLAPSATVAVSLDDRIAALAKAGNPKAALIVGLKFLNGDGVVVDVPTAAHWLGVAARGNEPLAQYWLATLYERGRGVPKDNAKAAQWYEPAAKAGNAKAMYRLGVAYVEGWNGEPDYGVAADWFTKAANFGVIDAQFNLAVLYERGEGVPQNFTNAFKWYAIAAAQGDAESKTRLDALASQIGSEGVMTAQKAASAFAAGEPGPAANAEPDERTVAGMK